MPDSSILKNAVVIGGGTGAPVSIRALRAQGIATSAVVAMADDGGSTGVLRAFSGIQAPGDIRKCLVAMAADPESIWARAFSKRFSYVNEHTLGNLMLTALSEAADSFPEAITLCERLLDAQGQVFPSTLENVKLIGITQDGVRLEGQARISRARTALRRVLLDPPDPAAFAPALEAIANADLIVLGPGSLYTSIIPNLLVPGVIQAIRERRGRTVFLSALADMQGETWGMNALEHVEALLSHGMEGQLDLVVAEEHGPEDLLANPDASLVDSASAGTLLPTPDVRPTSEIAELPIRRVRLDEALKKAITEKGIELLTARLVDPLRPTWHDVDILSNVFKGIIERCPSQRK